MPKPIIQQRDIAEESQVHLRNQKDRSQQDIGGFPQESYSLLARSMVDNEPDHVQGVDDPQRSCMQNKLWEKTGGRNQCQNGFTKDEIFMAMTFEHNSSSLGRQCQMVSAENNTSGPVPQCSKDVCSHQFRPSDQASFFMEMMSVHISSRLVLHQMTSDHNRSELGIHDHSNEQSSSKLANAEDNSIIYTIQNQKNSENFQKILLDILHGIDNITARNVRFNMTRVVRLGINPMIQPEPEDLPKDNPKLEIAVLSTAGRTGRLPVGGGFTFSMMKNGIVNENHE
ncbi:hypothetical protein Tco_1274094 [Tanacetum coccineum]